MQRNQRLIRRRADIKPGLAPGTIRVLAEAPVPVIDVFRFDATEIEHRSGIGPSDIPAADGDQMIWVNVVGLGDSKVLKEVATKFNIHALALEDVVNTHQQPKLEIYDDHLYVVLRMPTYNSHLDLEQVSLFVGKNYVLTWQERPGDCFEPVRSRLKSPQRKVRKHGSDFLAYALIDSVVDSFFPVLNEFNDAIDAIEERLDSDDLEYGVMRELHQLRTSIRILRRSARSHQTVVRDLQSDESDVIGDETQLHLRDVSDHASMLVDLLESARDSCTDLQDLHMSSVSMRMNEVMKVLTIIATIFMPLGFIAGLYGMNFSTEASTWNMPETQWAFGYPAVLGLMFLVGATMVAYFRRRGWI